MLTGQGAYDFAIEQGFKSENLLTDKSREDWLKWLEKSNYKPTINIENHDTISMLLIDSNRDIFGACTTSGAAGKLEGLVILPSLEQAFFDNDGSSGCNWFRRSCYQNCRQCNGCRDHETRGITIRGL